MLATNTAPAWTFPPPSVFMPIGPIPRAMVRFTRHDLLRDGYTSNNVFSYEQLMSTMLERPDVGYSLFRCACPSWDNTPRRRKGAHIYVGSTPQLYESWLAEVAKQTIDRFPPEERIVFVNAWNEWAEGCHLEPDQHYGRAYLEATRAAVESAR